MQPDILDSQQLHDLLSKTTLLTPKVHELEAKTKAVQDDLARCQHSVATGLQVGRQSFESLQHKLSEWESHLAASQKQIASEFDPIVANANGHKEELQSMTQRLQEAIETASHSLDAVTTSLDAKIKSLEQRRHDLDQAFTQIEHSADQHTQALTTSVQQAETQAQSLVSHLGQGEQQMAHALADLKSKIEATVAEITQGIATHDHHLDTAASAYQTNLDHLGQAIGSQSAQSGHKIDDSLKHAGEELKKIFMDLKTCIDETRQIFHQATSLTKELEDNAKPIMDGFKQLVAEVHSLAGPIESALHSAQAQAPSYQ